MRRLLPTLALVTLLGACASTGPGATRGADREPPRRAAPDVNLSGYNAAFKEGYMDGCDSARQARRRNASRYGTDTDYTMGWNDGNAMCTRR